MSASGTWTTHPIVRKATWRLLVAGVLGFAVLGALLWPLLVAVFQVLVIVVTHFWAALPYVVWFEVFVVVSARLDWREADLEVESLRHAWLAGHLTVWKRLAQRIGWVVGLSGVCVKQLEKTSHLDALHVPTKPARAVVVAADPIGEVAA